MLRIGNCYVIDFSKVNKDKIFELNIKSRDNKRYIDIQLIDNNNVINLSHYIISVKAVKNDGNIIFNDVKKINAELGRCRVEITPQMLCEGNELPCELILYGSDGTIASTSDFKLNIIKSPGDEQIQSSSEFSALSEALKTVSNIDGIVNEVNSLKHPNENLKNSLDKDYLNINMGDSFDFNLTVKPGRYSIGSGTTLPGSPFPNAIYGNLIVLPRRGSEVQQVFISIDGAIFSRFFNYLGQWGDWIKTPVITDFVTGNVESKHYAIFPNGLMIQWGNLILNFPGGSNYTKGYAYFPKTFTSDYIFNGSLARNNWAGYSDTIAVLAEDNPSRGFVEARCIDSSVHPTSDKTVTINWTAIGRY